MGSGGCNGESGHTSDHRSARRQRIEVITRGERRRRWTPEQKREIAAESLEPGASPVTVARRYGVSTGQLYTWRQLLLRGALGAAAEASPGFVRIDVLPVAGHLESAAAAALPALNAPALGIVPPAAPAAAQPADGRIEIALSGGVSVRVDAAVDEGALRRVLAALRQR